MAHVYFQMSLAARGARIYPLVMDVLIPRFILALILNIIVPFVVLFAVGRHLGRQGRKTLTSVRFFSSETPVRRNRK